MTRKKRQISFGLTFVNKDKAMSIKKYKKEKKRKEKQRRVIIKFYGIEIYINKKEKKKHLIQKYDINSTNHMLLMGTLRTMLKSYFRKFFILLPYMRI